MANGVDAVDKVDTADGVARRLAGGMANGVDAVDKVDTAD
jgi:hypothetical protein